MCLCSCTPCEGIHAQVTSQGGAGEEPLGGGRGGGDGRTGIIYINFFMYILVCMHAWIGRTDG